MLTGARHLLKRKRDDKLDLNEIWLASLLAGWGTLFSSDSMVHD
jgi:hypothetical protein